MKTPAEARDAWIEALRSGKYKQCIGALEITDSNGVVSNCCLGVHSSMGKLKNHSYLTELNDRRKPFEEIADLIEQNQLVTVTDEQQTEK